MPAELFRSLLVKRGSTVRRFGALPLSVAVHTIAIVAAVAIPLIAVTDVLPPPRVPVVLQIPPMPVVVVPHVPAPRFARSAPAFVQPSFPVVAPSGVTDPTIEPTPAPITEIGIGELLGSPDVARELVRPEDLVPPPPPAPKVTGPVRITPGLEPPRKVHDQAPVYPPAAILAHVEGTVIIEAIISTSGAVQEMRVMRSVPLLDQAALDAVRQWVFTPTRLHGVAVPVILTVNVAFKLQ